MATNELPAIYRPQSAEPFELTPQIQEALTKGTLGYYHQHKSVLPDFANGGLEIAGKIVTQAFLEGANRSSKQPSKPAEIQRLIKEGLAVRAIFLNEANKFLTDLDTEAGDLALPIAEITAAKTEYYNQYRIAEFPAINALAGKRNERSQALEKVSEQLLIPLLQRITLVDPKQIQSYIPDAARQSVVVRGMFVAGLGSLMSIHGINPLFVNDENIADITSDMNPDLVARQVNAIADSIMEKLDTDIPEETIKSLLVDYGNQTVDILLRWQNKQRTQNLTVGSEQYWERKDLLLKKLPITSFIPEIQYVFTRESLETAIQQGIPHIWDTIEVFHDTAFPSFANMQNALSLLRHAGYATDNEQIVAFTKAIDLYSVYYGAIHHLDTVIFQENEKIKNLTTYLRENAHLNNKDLNTVSYLSGRDRVLRGRLQKFHYYLEYQENIRIEVEKMERLIHTANAEEKTAMKCEIIQNKAKKSSLDIQRNIKGAIFNLQKTSIAKHILPQDEDSYSETTVAEDLIERVELYLQELAADKNKNFPSEFLDSDDFQRYLVSQLLMMQMSLSSKRYDKAQFDHLNKAIRYAQNKQLNWGGFRGIVTNSLRRSIYYLQNLQRLQARQECNNQLLHITPKAIAEGTVAPEVQQEFDLFTDEKLQLYIDELKMNLLPPEAARQISLDNIAESKKIAAHYDNVKIRIRFEKGRDIEEIIDEAMANRKNDSDLTFLGRLRTILVNPLFPLEFVEGKSLSQIMAALQRRTMAADALLHSEATTETYTQIKTELEAARLKKVWLDKRNDLFKAQRLSEQYTSERNMAEFRVWNGLSQLGFGIPLEEYNQLIQQTQE